MAEFRTAFADQAYLPTQGEFIQYVDRRFPLRIVAAHSVVPGRPAACCAMSSWLGSTARFPKSRTRRPLVMMHHPPFATGLPHFDAVGMVDVAGLEQVIARHPQVERHPVRPRTPCDPDPVRRHDRIGLPEHRAPGRRRPAPGWHGLVHARAAGLSAASLERQQAVQLHGQRRRLRRTLSFPLKRSCAHR